MTAVDLDRVEYSDEFSQHIRAGRPLSMEDVVRASNEMRYPSWIRVLFGVRDLVVRWFGIKTAKDYQPAKMPSAAFGIFPVLRRSDDELVAGDDDRHLNFRVVVNFREKANHEYVVSFRTLVQFNNWLGKLYFIPVQPLHKVIVPVMLKRLAGRIVRGEHRKPS